MTRAGLLTAATAAVLGLLGVLLSYPELLGLATGFTVLLLCSAGWLWLAPDLAVHRSLVPARVFQNGEVVSRLAFNNRRRTPSPPVLGYELVGNERVPIRVPRLSSGATMVAELKLPTTTRGLHLIPPLMLRGSDPFGLFDLSRSIGESSTLWIYPRPQAGVPALDDDAVRELDASVSARSLAGGTTFDGLRAYQPHDDSRLIHWPSYARSGELLVRHHIVGNESRHLVVLDTSDVYGDEESFEAAVRVAASWCAAGMSAAAAVSLATTDGLYVDVAAGYSDFDGARQLWEALARAQVHKGSRAPSTPVDLPSRAPATALGWVTGPLASEVSDTASALIQAVSHAAAARIGGALPTRIMHHPGLLEITAATPQAWAGAWGKAMGA